MTIKEIAKLANVSTSTISRVVNDSGYVKKEVREKIEALIEETGYRPNAYAKALLLNKSHTIGVILPKINYTAFQHLPEMPILYNSVFSLFSYHHKQ